MIYFKKGYCLTLICLMVYASVFAQQSNSNKSEAATKSVKGNGSSSHAMRGRWHWGKFYDDGPEDGPIVGCMPGGLICQDDPIEDEGNAPVNGKIKPDETIGEIEITLDGNNIVITATGDTSAITKETFEKFSAKSVENHNSSLPKELVEKLFERINLPIPEDKIVFSAANQTYAVINSTQEGKPVQIIKVTEKTNVKINGKEYNLTLNVTSGKPDKYKNQLQGLVFIGGGLTNPIGNEMRDSAFLGSGFNFNEGLYIPMFAKNKFTTGLEANINYISLKADNGLRNAQHYKVINGGSTGPAYIGELPKATSFEFLAGPRFNFDINKFYLAPSILLGYQTIKRDAFTIADSIYSINDPTNKTCIPSLSAGILKANGFVLNPKIKVGYNISSYWSIWASYDITLGPTLTTSYETFVPGGNPDSTGAYFVDQFLFGSSSLKRTDVKWQTQSLNVGLAYTFGKTKKSASETANSPAPDAIKGKIKSIKNDGAGRLSAPGENEVSYSYSDVPQPKKENQQENSCPEITAPENNSTQSIEQPLEIKIKSGTTTAQAKSLSVTVYKISSDEKFWESLDEKKRASYNHFFMSEAPDYAADSKNAGFTPINAIAKRTGDFFETQIDQGKLSAGAYTAVANSDGCSGTFSNFNIGTPPCGSINKTVQATCDQNTNGTQTYHVTITFTWATGPDGCSAIINNLTAASGTISNIATLPLTITYGGTHTITFTYTPTNPVPANVTFNWTEVWSNLPNGSFNDGIVAQLPPCACNYCDNMSWNLGSPIQTWVGNTITISQPLITNVTGNYQLLKAEIISFKRTVNDACMDCDKSSTQYGNFNSVTYNSLNGAAIQLPLGVGGGNAHHSVYWSNVANTGTFNFNISSPAFSALSCCCDIVTFSVRFTITTAECKTCSYVRQYSYAHGTCKTIGHQDDNGSSHSN